MQTEIYTQDGHKYNAEIGKIELSNLNTQPQNMIPIYSYEPLLQEICDTLKEISKTLIYIQERI